MEKEIIMRVAKKMSLMYNAKENVIICMIIHTLREGHNLIQCEDIIRKFYSRKVMQKVMQ